MTEATGPSSGGEVTKRNTTIVHEDCDLDSATGQDVSGDGKLDLAIVKSGSSEQCRALDLNFDGVWDTWVYKDPAGTVRRTESDFDRDGRIDEIAIYEGGQLVAKQRATTMAGKLDTWQYYKNGKLTQSERDSDGDAIIDQWWEYPESSTADCPLVHSDVDNDGRPDPGATVNMCPKDEMSAAAPTPPPKSNPSQFEQEEPPELSESVEGEADSAAASPPGKPAPAPEEKN